MEKELTLTMEQVMSAGEAISAAVHMAVVELRGGGDADCAYVCGLVGQFFLEKSQQQEASFH